MGWYKAALPASQLNLLAEQFDKLWMAAGHPRDMALFGIRALGEISGEEVEVYFSPGSLKYAKELIERCQGLECEQPPASNLALIAGHQDVVKGLSRE